MVYHNDHILFQYISCTWRALSRGDLTPVKCQDGENDHAGVYVGVRDLEFPAVCCSTNGLCFG